MTQLQKSLLKCNEVVFYVADRSSKQWKFFSALLFYLCDIHEAKKIFIVLHGYSISHSWVHGISPITNIQYIRNYKARYLEQTKRLGKYTKEKAKQAKRQSEEI